VEDLSRNQAVRYWKTGRVEAVSDGVFAIALTLLVIDIRVAPGEYRHLVHALVEEWPGYLAYLTSFVTIGGVWLAHHSLFTRLKFIDSWLLTINLVLLMAVAFLPFPTGVLAQALNSSAEAQDSAVVFYGISALSVELVLGFLEHYPETRLGLTTDDGTREPARHTRHRRITISTIAYAVAIPVGLTLPDVAALAYLAIAIGIVGVTASQANVAPRKPKRR